MKREDFARLPVPQKIAHLASVLATSDIKHVVESQARRSADADLTSDKDQHLPFEATELQQAYLLGRSGFDAAPQPSHMYQEFELRDADVHRIEAAWNRLVEAHPMLRATFTPTGELCIKDRVPYYRIETVDARSDADRVLDATRQELSGRAMPADTWPLFCLRLSRIDARRSRLHVVIDLLIADARSIRALYGELEALYSDPARPVRSSPLSFRDYRLAMREHAKSPASAAAREYWNRKFSTIAPGPSIVEGKGDRTAHSHRRLSWTFSAWREFQARCQAAGVPSHIALLCAYAEVLASWTAQERFTVVFVSGRRLPLHPNIDSAIGDFTTLCWYEAAADGRSFLTKLRDAHQSIERDIANSAVSGITALRRRTSGRNGDRALLFPVVMTDTLPSCTRPVASSFEEGDGLTRTASVSLDCVNVDHGDSLSCNWDYDAGAMDADVVRRMFDRYGSLLSVLASDAGAWQRSDLAAELRAQEGSGVLARRAALRRLPAEERRKLVCEWNDTRTDYNRDICIHQLIERQALMSPDAPATYCGGSGLSYRELNARANQLARHLIQRGVKPNQLVGICVERSHDTIVILLAILKAGGAYVPLDAGESKGRIPGVVEKAKLRCIVTNSRLRGLVEPHVPELVCVDTEAAVIRSQVAHDLNLPECSASNLAYVIFTSGSTGAPKGVAVKHRPVINLIEWVGKTFGLGPGDTALFTTALGFDLSVFDIFGMLALGARVHIASDAQRKDPEALARTLAEEEITFWNSAPAALGLLVPRLRARPTPLPNDRLRLVFLSGDWIPLALPHEIRRAFPAAEVVSLGGATEATVWSNYFRIGEIDPTWRSIPYGRPIQNARYYILDEGLEPCPVGVEGDLYIGGECLSEGYLNDQVLTDNAFIKDPFVTEGPGIMYRTGDRARFFPDGNIEFLGRKDFQVKINGFRIELGEIEHRLRSNAAIQEAVVVAREDVPGDKKLVAYIVCSGAQPPAAKEIREYVKQTLPEYMVPHVVIPMDTLPATANGKLDRAALPWPPPARPAAPEQAEARRTAAPAAPVVSMASIADTLSGVVKGYLTCAELSETDDLFDLGATSLTMMRLVQKARDRFGVQIPIETVLTEPTILSLSRFVHEALAASSARAGVPAQDAPKTRGGGHAADESAARSRLAPAERGVTRQEATRSTLGRILDALRDRGVQGERKHLYPSAGGIYSTQLYVAVSPGGIAGLEEGTYYYHPVHHGLYKLSSTCGRANDAAHAALGYSLYLVADMTALRAVYGPLAERLALVDSGYMAQLLADEHARHGIRMTQADERDFEATRPLFDLGREHTFCLRLIGRQRPVDAGHRAMAPSRQTQTAAKHGVLVLGRGAASRAEHAGELELQILSVEEQNRIKKEHPTIRSVPNVSAVPLDVGDQQEGRRLRRSSQRAYLGRVIPRASLRGLLGALDAYERDATALLKQSSSVQVYVTVRAGAVEELAEGLYRFDPAARDFTRIAGDVWGRIAKKHLPFNRKHRAGAAFEILLVAVPAGEEASSDELSLEMSLFQAGMMGQRLMDAQAARDLGLCPIGALLRVDDLLHEIGLPAGSAFLHGLIGGAVDYSTVASVDRRPAPAPVEGIVVAPPRSTVVGSELSSGARPRGADLYSGHELSEVAIIGMACRFPGAEDPEAFWDSISQGSCTVRSLPPQRRRELGFSSSDDVRGAFLDEISAFDHRAFKVSPLEARTMDPQERLFLQLAWECLESAGYSPRLINGSAKRVGVFVGVMWADYQGVSPGVSRQDLPSSFHSAIASRVSFFFDFKGPSIAVDSSCSSGLTALHLASESLRRGECDVALVGAVNLVASRSHYDLLRHLDLLSDDAQCRSFAADATGWTVGEGGAAVLLRPRDEAERQGDCIHALLQGTMIGHTGRTARYSTPSSSELAASLGRFLGSLSLSADSVGYVECAAPGASVADAAELSALATTFASRSASVPPCPIGSVKPNIGHLESASAMSQLIKVVQQMRHETIAPTILRGPANPLADLSDGTIFVNQSARRWEIPVAGGELGQRLPRRAMINAMGASGSFGHALVDEYPRRAPSRMADQPTLVPVSAPSPEQLRRVLEKIERYLSTPVGAELPIADIGYTLAVGRTPFEHRFAAVVRSTSELREKLGTYLRTGASAGVHTGQAGTKPVDEVTSAERDLLQIAEQWVEGRAELIGISPGRRVPLPTYAFDRATHWIGEQPVIAVATDNAVSSSTTARGAAPGDPMSRGDRVKVESYLRGLIASVAGMSVHEVRADAPLEEYGINSLMITRMNSRLQGDIGKVSKALFFEHRRLVDVAGALLESHSSELGRLLGFERQATRRDAVERPSTPSRPRSLAPTRAGDIAIVGIAGRYPKANNLEQLWQNLSHGVDCITEIPLERWDYRPTFAPTPGAPGRSYCKWGAFIDNHDQFDPLFFRISPKEAALMDPHQRLFLELSWELFENAGYSMDLIAETFETQVGVFVGVMYGDYQFFGVESALRGHPVALNSSYGSVANQVSYLYDFSGPSMAIDTMCSSSLTALHMAVQSIHSGDCRAAIVGGVNFTMHPNKYMTISQMRMASPTGRCRPFSKEADGFVPGEGGGAILLRPLSHAEADGDRILAVIKATAINHGGRTHGYTVPNPNRQAALVEAALRKAGVDPADIGYVEAHGTGTSLGDPIEIAGLTKAFSRAAEKKQFCAIGSLKSNLGHLEAAAGIAGITKVILQLEHRKLLPSLHAEELNPAIDFDNSPFYVQRELADWPLPAASGEVPRRRLATVSAFGAGGANGHVILEEYVPEAPAGETEVSAPQVFVLSARTRDQLVAYAASFAAKIRALRAAASQGESGRLLGDIAYTTQAGRTPMAERLAIVTASLDDLEAKLSSFVSGQMDVGDLYCSNAADRGRYDALLSGEEGAELVRVLLRNQSLSKLAHLWVSGAAVPWTLLERPRRPRKLALPTYPFERTTCWIQHAGVRAGPRPVPSAHDGSAGLPAPTPESRDAGESDVLLRPDWTAAVLPSDAQRSLEVDAAGGITVLFGAAERFAAALDAHEPVVVKVGPSFEKQGRDYTVRSDREEDYARLFSEVCAEGARTVRVVYVPREPGEIGSLEQLLLGDLGSLVRVLRGWAEQASGRHLDVLCLHPTSADQSAAWVRALTGFFKSAAQELSGLRWKVVGIPEESFADDAAEIARILTAETSSASWQDAEVRYENRARLVKRYKEVDFDARVGHGHPRSWLRESGTYLITGGGGRLALHVARHIASAVRATLLLVGRRAPSAGAERELRSLAELGSRVVYMQADLSDRASVARLISGIRSDHGALNGVIHAAGALSDSLLVNKTDAEIARVLGGKALGAVWLDEQLKDEGLDFFVMFSSMVGATGNAGQTDYAFANACLDQLAEWRRGLEEKGLRRGRTLSIGWPYWEDGGMTLDGASVARLTARTGLMPLSTERAWGILDQLMSSREHHVVVAHGVPDRLATFLAERLPGWMPASGRQAPTPASVATRSGGSVAAERYVELIHASLARQTGAGAAHIDIDTEFEALGLTSIMAVSMIDDIDEELGVKLYVNELRVYNTARKLSQHLQREVEQLNVGPEPPAAADDAPSLKGAGGGRPDAADRYAASIVNYLARHTGAETSRIGLDAEFESLGMTSIMTVSVIDDIDEEYGVKLYVNELRIHNTTRKLSQHLRREVERLNADTGPSLGDGPTASQGSLGALTEPPTPSVSGGRSAKDERPTRPLVFVLSTPRSGSTLLRVMLMGCKQLFSPPELHLLQFDRLGQRKRALDESNQSFLREGLIESIKELEDLDVAQAIERMERFEAEDWSIEETYAYLKRLCGERGLVDKSPTYAASIDTLRRSSELDSHARYIFLYRHPMAVMESFVRNRFDKMLNMSGDAWRLAEETWFTMNQNILRFLEDVPPEQKHMLRYENIVSNPEITMLALCDKFGFPYDPLMLRPYEEDRMTKGLRENSLSIGDPAFLKHKEIDPNLALAWKQRVAKQRRPLSAATIQLALRLGYTRADLDLPVAGDALKQADTST
ncbi:amino acid adenylation domain-containing protein [Sorangium sp. So ce269]